MYCYWLFLCNFFQALVLMTTAARRTHRSRTQLLIVEVRRRNPRKLRVFCATKSAKPTRILTLKFKATQRTLKSTRNQPPSLRSETRKAAGRARNRSIRTVDRHFRINQKTWTTMRASVLQSLLQALPSLPATAVFLTVTTYRTLTKPGFFLLKCNYYLSNF